MTRTGSGARESLLQEHDWLARASIHTIAATGEVDAARELLDRDPSQASLVGGPHGWEPLLYLTYSRVPLGPGRSAVAVARLLLEHGADPNAGYLWEGLVPPFTALTGALGRRRGTLPRSTRRSSRSPVCCWRPALTRTMGRRSTTAAGARTRERTGSSCCSSSGWAPATAGRGAGCSASGKTHPGRCSRTC